MFKLLALFIALFAAQLAPRASSQDLSAEQREELRSLLTGYSVAIRDLIVDRLTPVPWQGKGACTVELTQLPGGQVIRASLSDCEFPEDIQNQVIARLETMNTPYQGFERVFRRTFTIRLR